MISYCLLPRRKFLFRLILPAILLFFASSILIGEFTHAFFPDIAPGRAVVATFQTQKQFIQTLSATPFYCRVGDGLTSNEHRAECTQITDRILVTGLTGGFPFLVVLFFLVFGFHELTSLYCQVTAQVSSGRVSCLGKYEGNGGSHDWFALLFCLKSIEIRDEQGQSLRIYLPLGERQLPQGARVAVFDVGRWFFIRRKFGVVDFHAIPASMSQRV